MKVQFVWMDPEIRTLVGFLTEKYDEFDDNENSHERSSLSIGFLFFEILISVPVKNKE